MQTHIPGKSTLKLQVQLHIFYEENTNEIINIKRPKISHGVIVVIKKKKDFYKSTNKEILRIEKILRRVKSKRNKKQPESESSR